jgi:hypothetical protein
MAPQVDDAGIGNDQWLLRALLRKWITTKGGRERPSSESFDSTYETSCFLEAEISLEDVRAYLVAELGEHAAGLAFARIPVAAVREAGFAVERRPEEAVGCANPAAHVVIGPIGQMPPKDYLRAAKAIVTDLRVTIVRPIA